MHAFGRLVSKLLIWLTAIAMPLQAGWAADCGCAIAQPRVAAASNSTVPVGCCCCAPVQTSAACCEASKPKRSCCSHAATPDAHLGCQCGPDCRCAERDDSPIEPAAPAPDNGREQSEVKLAVSHAVATAASSADGFACHSLSESVSAFSTPGTQVCVLLCRFKR